MLEVIESIEEFCGGCPVDRWVGVRTQPGVQLPTINERDSLYAGIRRDLAASRTPQRHQWRYVAIVMERAQNLLRTPRGGSRRMGIADESGSIRIVPPLRVDRDEAPIAGEDEVVNVPGRDGEPVN